MDVLQSNGTLRVTTMASSAVKSPCSQCRSSNQIPCEALVTKYEVLKLKRKSEAVTPSPATNESVYDLYASELEVRVTEQPLAVSPDSGAQFIFEGINSLDGSPCYGCSYYCSVSEFF